MRARDKSEGGEGRGWGPFTGRQLTTIICVGLVVALFPVGAWALSFSNVAITDPGGVNQAKVDTRNNLNTALHDPVYGYGARVNRAGQLSATVAGSVSVNGTARPADPADLFTRRVVLRDGSVVPQCVTVAPSSGHALVITSVTENELAIGSAPTQVSLFRSGTCDSGLALTPIADSIFTAIGSSTIPFPSGLVIPNGWGLILHGQTGKGSTTSITVNGYQIPSSYCPSADSCLLGD